MCCKIKIGVVLLFFMFELSIWGNFGEIVFGF